MNPEYLRGLFLPVVFLSSAAFSHQLSCEIYDLATGDILAESGPILIKPEDLRKAEPYKLSLEHALMNADFQLGFLDAHSETLSFQIRTHEILNSETGKFLVSTSNFKTGTSYVLGRVFTEITGLGDNTMSSCSLIIKK